MVEPPISTLAEAMNRLAKIEREIPGRKLQADLGKGLSDLQDELEEAETQIEEFLALSKVDTIQGHWSPEYVEIVQEYLKDLASSSTQFTSRPTPQSAQKLGSALEGLTKQVISVKKALPTSVKQDLLGRFTKTSALAMALKGAPDPDMNLLARKLAFLMTHVGQWTLSLQTPQASMDLIDQLEAKQAELVDEARALGVDGKVLAFLQELGEGSASLDLLTPVVSKWLKDHPQVKDGLRISWDA